MNVYSPRGELVYENFLVSGTSPVDVGFKLSELFTVQEKTAFLDEKQWTNKEKASAETGGELPAIQELDADGKQKSIVVMPDQEP